MCLGCACPGAPAQCVRATFERALPVGVLRSRARTHVQAVAASRSVSASKRYYYFRPGVAMASREVFESHATTRDGRRPNRELRARAAAASGSARCGSRHAPRRSAPRAAEPLGCSVARASAREPGAANACPLASPPSHPLCKRRACGERRVPRPRHPPPETRARAPHRMAYCTTQRQPGSSSSYSTSDSDSSSLLREAGQGGRWGKWWCGWGGWGGVRGSWRQRSIDAMTWVGATRPAAWHGARCGRHSPRSCGSAARTDAPHKKKKKLGRAAPRCGARACPIPSPSARRTSVRPTQPAAGRTSERFLLRGRSVARGGGTPRGGRGASGVPAPPQRARVRFAPAGVFFVFPW